MQDKISSAKDCLENVCPLIELLPATSGHESHRFAEEGCFSLLRELYRELMERRRDPEAIDSNIDHSQNNIRRRIGIGVYESHDRDSTSEDAGLVAYRDSSRYLPENFDIEGRIDELRAPFDHLRNELRHSRPSALRTRDPPLISRSDLPVIVFDEAQLESELLDLKDLEFGAVLSEAFLESETAELGKHPKSSLRLNEDIESLIKRFVYENEGGRIKVFAETRKMVDSIRSKLLAEVSTD
jgi:hypothetical protein